MCVAIELTNNVRMVISMENVRKGKFCGSTCFELYIGYSIAAGNSKVIQQLFYISMGTEG